MYQEFYGVAPNWCHRPELFWILQIAAQIVLGPLLSLLTQSPLLENLAWLWSPRLPVEARRWRHRWGKNVSVVSWWSASHANARWRLIYLYLRFDLEIVWQGQRGQCLGLAGWHDPKDVGSKPALSFHSKWNEQGKVQCQIWSQTWTAKLFSWNLWFIPLMNSITVHCPN